MELYILLNLVSIYLVPLYSALFFPGEQFRVMNQKLLCYVTAFALLSYTRSYNLPSFCFKFFTFAKFLIIGQYGLYSDQDMLLYFLAINALTFYHCIQPFPKSCPVIIHLDHAQHSALLESLDNRMVYIFYYVSTYDRCKACFYSYNKIVQEYSSRGDVSFNCVNLYRMKELRKEIEDNYQLCYYDFPLMLGYKNKKMFLCMPDHNTKNTYEKQLWGLKELKAWMQIEEHVYVA